MPPPNLKEELCTFINSARIPYLFMKYRVASGIQNTAMINRLGPLHFVALALGVLWCYWYTRKQPVELHGYTHPRFEAVRKMFRDMIQSDREGAAMAVLHKNELVVDLYGGYADRKSNKLWTKDTMAVAFSTTKIWAGLTAAILASRGLLQYDMKVMLK
ncbi:hypothetical protein ANCCAN_01031 [Ancylostoma caninum]|uniref:Beta-lactamase-related domain-containing protein n=1 Tax=Ancylostoma caninum TaxID=29170 RepID=A0A368HBL8_ANCCA|nr:hypothetical protein ANCCAN_01031 [Ancylostoma caninum]